jgi:hypothetical protein
MKKHFITRFIKRPLFLLEERFPRFGAWFIALLRRVRAMYYRMFLIFGHIRQTHIASDRILWVRPDEVTYARGGADLRMERGKIEGGDWDKDPGFFVDTPTYRGMHERFVERKKWQDTNFYTRFAQKIREGGVVWRCTTVEQFEKRLARLDALFADMKNNGYRAPGDPEKIDIYEGKKDPAYEPFDEVSLNIARDGRLLFADGAHRLAMAKILGIESIPARVVKRHKKWMQFRAEVEEFARHSPGGKLYQQAFHPDLAYIPYAHGPERWETIRSAIQTQKGKALDIGANFGLFCYTLERALGFECTAVEINPQEAYLGKKMRDALGATFEIHTGSVFDLPDEKLASYNVVLALNIFHHFLKRKVEHDRLVAFLGKLKCAELFLETHNPGEPQMAGAYRNYQPDEFTEFVIKHTTLEKAEPVCETSNGRVLYRIF